MSIVVKYIIVFFVSMVPLIELRGAIPIAVGLGLNKLISFIIAIIGNMLPVPFIYLFARKILEWGKDKKVIGSFFTWCLNKGERGGRKLEEKAGKGLYWALFLFVGIKRLTLFPKVPLYFSFPDMLYIAHSVLL